MQLASKHRLLISGSVLASRVSKAGGAEMAPEGIWHSGSRAREHGRMPMSRPLTNPAPYVHLQLPRVTFFEELG